MPVSEARRWGARGGILRAAAGWALAAALPFWPAAGDDAGTGGGGEDVQKAKAVLKSWGKNPDNYFNADGTPKRDTNGNVLKFANTALQAARRSPGAKPASASPSPAGTGGGGAAVAGGGGTSPGGDLGRAFEALRTKGLDPEKYLAVGSDGQVSLQGNYMDRSLPQFEVARAAIQSAGVDLSRVNVRDAIRNFSQAEIANKAREILASEGANPDAIIRVDGSGAVSMDAYNSAASRAMAQARSDLGVRAFSPATVRPASAPGSGPAGLSRMPAAAPGGAPGTADLARARDLLASKGMDPEQYLAVGADGGVAVSGNYMDHSLPRFEEARTAIQQAGIDLSSVNLRDALPALPGDALARKAQEIIRASGGDPSAVRVGAGGEVSADPYNSLASQALRQASSSLRVGLFTAALPPAPRAGGTEPGLPPVAPPPAGGEIVVPPAAGPVPPDGLRVDVADSAARSLVEKANALNRAENFAAAAPVYQQALEKAKGAGDLQAAAWAMVGLGMDQRKLDDRDASQKTYHEAVNLLQFLRADADPGRQKDGDRLLAIAEHGLASIDLVRGNIGDALEHYRRSAAYYKEGGFDALVSLSGNAMRIEQMEGKLRAAGKAVPGFGGLPDPKEVIASGYGRPPSPPPAPGAAPPPPPAGGVPGDAAVPTALPVGDYGFGLTKGGEGGRVLTVTSLADSGPGTLRDALAKADAQGGGAVIRFGVEGAIRLNSTLFVKSPNITIDGFSAPGKGVTIYGDHAGGADIHVKTHDVVIRNLAVRNGYDLIRVNPDSTGDTASVHHILLDHVSLTNASDGAVDITKGAHDITVQWSYIAGAGTPGETSGGGGSSLVKYGSTNVTFHHNLFDKDLRRSPLAYDAFVDFRNNVVRDWQQFGSQFESGGRGNAVGNIYVATSGGTPSDAVQKSLYGYHGPGAVYFQGNLYKGLSKVAPYGQGTASAPLGAPSVPTQGAEEAEKAVYQYAGKWSGGRDEVDLKYMSLPNYAAVRAYNGQ